MATDNITDKNTLKSWFKRGLKPLEVQFHAWMDSYWHKSESIPTSSIENLETTLNSKAESSSVEVITKEIEEHINDTGMHKTEKEQSKLDNLADNPDATYASKDELGGVEPVIFYATYTGNAETKNRRYSISIDQRERLVEYFNEGKTAPVILQVTSSEDTTEFEKYIMTEQKLQGIERSLIFVSIGSPSTNVLSCIHRIKLRFIQMSSGAITAFSVTGSDLNFGESEYKMTRYTGVEDGYDMNTFTQSGGIVAFVRPATGELTAISGMNIPEGFTMMNGYVLADSAGCTQVISDAILKKTVMRSKLMNGEWTDWGEVITKTNETIVFHATYSTVDGVKKYVFKDGQTSEYVNYFDEGKINSVILNCSASDNTTPSVEIYQLEKIIHNNSAHEMHFIGIDNGTINRIVLRGIKALSNAWSGRIDMYNYKYNFEESEYKYERYITEKSFDMNDFIESGGISAYTDEENGVVGTNIPEGFTDFYGYVLCSNGGGRRSMCCTQVVTDMILKKTMIRSSVPTEDYRSAVWLPWKELGENTKIHVVTEYPTDLTTYADGSIFIKQQAS